MDSFQHDLAPVKSLKVPPEQGGIGEALASPANECRTIKKSERRVRAIWRKLVEGGRLKFVGVVCADSVAPSILHCLRTGYFLYQGNPSLISLISVKGLAQAIGQKVTL
jgi:hypothetical protein